MWRLLFGAAVVVALCVRTADAQELYGILVEEGEEGEYRLLSGNGGGIADEALLQPFPAAPMVEGESSVYRMSEEAGPLFEQQPEEDWTSRVGTLWMTRDAPHSISLLQNPPGTTLFNANLFDFDYSPGVDAKLIRRLNDDYSVFGRFVFIGDMTSTGSSYVPSGGSAFFGTSGATSFTNDFDSNHFFLLDTQVASGEIGIRRRICGPWLFVGGAFRWAELNEELRDTFISPTDPTFDGVLATNTQNDLYGFQLGADGQVPLGERFSLDYFGNAGVYHNHARAGSSFVFVGTVEGSATARRNLTALLAEVGLGMNCRLTDRVTLRGGYRVMWLDGVALAPDQLQKIGTLNSGPTQYSMDTGTLLLHGCDFMAVVTF